MPEPAPERTMALGRTAAMVPPDADPGQVRTLLYREGLRERETDTVQEARQALTADPDLMAWVSMTDPNRTQLTELARTFGLPSLAVEDAIVAHQRPKAEVYRKVLFVVLRPARYDDVHERVDIGEVHLFASENFVLTIRHTDQIDFEDVRERLESGPRRLAHGPLAVMYAVADAVVDAYAPVVSGLQDDIDEVENQVFDGDPGASRRTYRLAREVILLQRAVDPLDGVLRDLMAPLEHPGRVAPGLPRARGSDQGLNRLHNDLRDVADHETAVRERIDGFRELLQNIMAVNNTLIDQSQNEAMKKVSSWGGILVVPTLIASFYGMNIAPHGLMHWVFSWPTALIAMAASSIGLYAVFRRRGWL